MNKASQFQPRFNQVKNPPYKKLYFKVGSVLCGGDRGMSNCADVNEVTASGNGILEIKYASSKARQNVQNALYKSNAKLRPRLTPNGKLAIAVRDIKNEEVPATFVTKAIHGRGYANKDHERVMDTFDTMLGIKSARTPRKQTVGGVFEALAVRDINRKEGKYKESAAKRRRVKDRLDTIAGGDMSLFKVIDDLKALREQK